MAINFNCWIQKRDAKIIKIKAVNTGMKLGMLAILRIKVKLSKI